MPSKQSSKWMYSHTRFIGFSNAESRAVHCSGTHKAVATSLPLLLLLPLEIREDIYQYFVQSGIIEDRKELEYFSEY